MIPKIYLKAKAESQRKKVILNQAKKNKEIIYGAHAMNKQLKGLLKRETYDYDVFAKSPKKSAKQLEKSMDKIAGFDNYYTKPAIFPGTTKVMDIGNDLKRGTADDFNIADYSKRPKKIRTIMRNGVKYAHISEIKKDRLKSLRDKDSKFRHKKDWEDLQRIKLSKKYDKFKRR